MTKKILAFIGSYAEASDPGVYVCTFDGQTGELQVTDSVSGLHNPTFLDVDPQRKTVYALGETASASGERGCEAVAFEADVLQGKLRFINREAAIQAPACHLSLDRQKGTLFTSSYHGGLIGVSSVTEDGRVGSLSQSIRHEGSSVLPVQSQARVHSVFIDKQNRYAAVCDLGLDQIVIYRYDAEAHQLIRQSETRTAPGAGPRHFAFHPTLAYGFVINELNSTITSYHYDEEAGKLTEIETVPTLPDSFTGNNSTADIHVSPDGRFLYGSNRGHDSIVVFAVDGTSGKLTLVEHVSSGGGHPRNFALSPDGRFLLAANRDSNNVVGFERNEDTGKLQRTGTVLELSKPVCIKFMTV
ncbi:lactonase family protein [Paenibacillus hamazuiensis]|uniref:lactonase family protein n=1 Tax=Paenibacillus hamazuiensis TaxID=2936508 RepID=UPI00200D3285|nr:lactonase family protein [Paenibacillus hamazuiensis]